MNNAVRDVYDYSFEFILDEHKKAVNKRNSIVVYRKEEVRKKRERLYFLKQKVVGLFLIIITILLCNSNLMYDITTGKNDWTIALITIPIGLILLFSKEKYWMDNYCLKH